MESYAQEAKERWGNTDVHKISLNSGHVVKMTKEYMAKIKKVGEDLTREIAESMSKGASSPEVQALITKHYNGLRVFYEPNIEMYRGLGQMCVRTMPALQNTSINLHQGSQDS